MTNSKQIRKASLFLAIIIGLTATLLMPTSGTPVEGQNLTPAAPTNLEMTDNRTDDALGHVAVLQWDYDDGEGYLLESRDGSSGPWNCIVAGTYSSKNPPAPARSAPSTRRHGRQRRLALPGPQLQLPAVLLPRRSHLRRGRRLRIHFR